MAIDTRQKRMSAIHLASPWRGPMVDATESGFNSGNRAAADFMYSGIAAAPPPVVTSREWISTDEPTIGTPNAPIVLGDLGG